MMDRDTKIFNKEAALLHISQAVKKIDPDFNYFLIGDQGGNPFESVSKDDLLLSSVINEIILNLILIEEDWFSLNDFHLAVKRGINTLAGIGYSENKLYEVVASDMAKHVDLNQCLTKPIVWMMS